MLTTGRAWEQHDCADVQAEEVQAARERLLDGDVARRLAGVFRALSDPTRLRIISALSEAEFCVGDLAAALELAQPAVSHQLSDMREMRLVRFRRVGRHIYYRLDDEHVRDLFAQGLAHIKHQ
jgi:ArsR family transcriptional regulator